MSPFAGVDLGRASGKFEGLIKSLSSLPVCKMNHEDLTDLLSSTAVLIHIPRILRAMKLVSPKNLTLIIRAISLLAVALLQ